MPKVVDHDARRAEIARAALRLCARDGPAALTIGQVAVEAGISKGLVQHYFPAKDALVRLTARTLRDDIATAVATAVAATAANGGTPAAVLRQVLLALASLDAEQVLAGHAFLARAGADPEVARLYRDGSTASVAAVAQLLVAAGGSPAAALSDARVLLAVAQSLADARILDQVSPEEIAAVLDRHLALLLSAGAAPLTPPTRTRR